MVRLTLDEYDAIQKKPGVRTHEGKPVVLEDGSSLCPVRITRNGFRPIDAVVAVPAPPPEDEVSPGAKPCPTCTARDMDEPDDHDETCPRYEDDGRCHGCGAEGERSGHMGCVSPQDHHDELDNPTDPMEVER